MKKGDDGLFVWSPYHKDLPSDAKKLGGRWSPQARAWIFDPRDESRVRDLYREIYGTDGSPCETVTVRYTVDSVDEDETELYVCGRQVARKRYRDESPRLGDGVVVISGGFPRIFGSRKNPRLGGEGTVLEIRDVPRKCAEDEDLEIVSEIDRDGLKAERDSLLKRLAEINEILGE
jgi:hypothetical protein